MKREEFIRIVKRELRLNPDTVFMYTDPVYLCEDEWDENVSAAKPFDEYINEFLDCQFNVGHDEFCDQDMDDVLNLLDIVRIRANVKWEDRW